jgi:DNA polymerase-1
VIVAWDGGIPEFRREKLPSYKSNRHVDDEDAYRDFIRQMNELRTEALPLSGVLSVMRRGVEADDIMYQAAYISNYVHYDKIIIVSGDEDMIQAVKLDKTYVYNTSKKVLINHSWVKKEFGIPVEKYVHWRALQGDSSDNIKGVPGIGPKRATEFFQKYSSLSGIINAPIRGKIGENIREFGIEGLSRNVYVMALYADRTGSRLSLYDDAEHYESANIKVLKQYMIRNEFIALMEGSFFKPLRELAKPKFALGYRTPVVCCRRFPIEED